MYRKSFSLRKTHHFSNEKYIKDPFKIEDGIAGPL